MKMRMTKEQIKIFKFYNTPLSYVTELFNLFKLNLLISIKIHLKVASFAFNIAIFFKE